MDMDHPSTQRSRFRCVVRFNCPRATIHKSSSIYILFNVIIIKHLLILPSSTLTDLPNCITTSPAVVIVLTYSSGFLETDRYRSACFHTMSQKHRTSEKKFSQRWNFNEFRITKYSVSFSPDATVKCYWLYINVYVFL